MLNLTDVKKYLADYDGPEMNIMEVCGSHTAAISKLGIRSLVSDNIHLLSGPGCPVCVTPSAYIDRLIELSKKENTIICTFGDLIRVPGSVSSLADEKGNGAKVKMVYSPMDTLTLAKNDRKNNYIFAAVGFETTTPVYALLVDTIIRENIKNVKILTAIKTMPEVINYLLSNGAKIDGFIAPGHVSVITGTRIYEPIAKEYSIPFGVAGFKGMELLTAITGIIKNRNKGLVENYYPSVVREEGNIKAQNLINKYFDKCDAVWRGMGIVANSGRMLRLEYRDFDAGSDGLNDDHKLNGACRCDEVLMGKITPDKCPLFRKVCTPTNPQGACMVSTEGSCHAYITY